MTHGFNEQRQKDLLALGYEDRQKGNSGYYLPARIELEIRDTNERAQALYDACCEVWEIHGLKRTRAFYRAVFDNCLQLLFETRRVTVAAELQHRDAVMRAPGRSSAAQGSLTRRMGQLRATWNQKLEKETRDCETRERVERQRAALLPSVQVRSAPAVMNLEGEGEVTMLKIEQVCEIASTFSWKDLESRFQEFQTKAGRKFSATFIRTDWESGDVSQEWIVGGNPVWRKEFEHLAAIAARKLGYMASKDASAYWLNRVREWMQEGGLDKEKDAAWLPTGTVNRGGAIGTTQSLYTESIAAMSAMFCMELFAHGTPESAVLQPAAAPTQTKMGRKAKRPPEFIALAGNLWNRKKGPTGNVSDDGLKEIGDELDSRGFTPPAKYLEGKAAIELKARNSKNANSKNGGAIRTWSALVTRGDKDERTAMRRLLIRCAPKQP
jgi:hypothetical protein